MHLGVQRERDGEDSEDGKGGGSAEGGSRAWWLLGIILSSWGPPGYPGCGGHGNVLGRTHVRQMVHACTMHGPWEV